MAAATSQEQTHVWYITNQRCEVGDPGVRFWPKSEWEPYPHFWTRIRLQTLTGLSGHACNFVAVHLTSVQFILQLKLCLYITVHLLLEEFKISLKSSLSTQSLCHTISPRVGVGVWFSARSRSQRVGCPTKKQGLCILPLTAANSLQHSTYILNSTHFNPKDTKSKTTVLQSRWPANCNGT